MSVKENKELIMRVNEEFNAIKGDTSKADAWVDKFMAPDIVFHSAGQGDMNFEQTKQLYRELVTAFNPVITVKNVLSEGNMIAFNGSWSGTHQGVFKGIPATGNKVKVDIAFIIKIKGDKAEEEWTYQDALGLMGQIGTIPSSTPAK